MKKIFIALNIILFNYHLYAQVLTGDTTKIFLAEFANFHNTSNYKCTNKTLHVSDKIIIDYEIINSIFKRNKTAIFYKYKDFSTEKIDSLTLTTEECNYILDQVNLQTGKYWIHSDIDNVKWMKETTIDSLFKNTNDTLYIYDNFFNGYLYYFSKPIFIRDNTICLFQYECSCGPLCGSGELLFYIKINGKWIRFEALSRWIS